MESYGNLYDARMSMDQVRWLRAFEQDHLDIEIRPPDYLSGARLWSAHRNGVVLCAEFELSSVFDSLASLLRGAE